MTDVFVEKDNVNDETVMVLTIYAENNTNVVKGQIVLEIETSKTVFEIEAPENGFLELYIEENQEVEIGTKLFSINAKKDIKNNKETTNQDEESKDTSDVQNSHYIFTKAAEKKLKELNISNFESKNKLINEEEVVEFYSKTKISDENNIDNLSHIKKKFNKDDVVILGAGGHAKSIIDIIENQNKIKISGICSDDEIGSQIREYEILGDNAILEALYENGLRNIIIGFGSLRRPPKRDEIYSKLKNIGFSFPKIICPTANIEKSAAIGEGTQIFMGSNICSDVQIAENCIINTGSIVSHDCNLSRNVHLTPGAVLAGYVNIGKNTLIGMLSSVYLGINIGENVIVHNNTRITKNIDSGSIISDNH